MVLQKNLLLLVAICIPGCTVAWGIAKSMNPLPFVRRMTSSEDDHTRKDFLALVSLAVVGESVSTTFSRAAIASDDDNGIITTKTGLKYYVTKGGAGDKPQRAQKVSAQYTLWLDGFESAKQIDSSRGVFFSAPFSFYAGTGGVIKGWDEAILDMRVGEARRLIVPSSLGYGDRGSGAKIPGGATLYFDVELVGMEPLQLTEKQRQWVEDHPL
mmetsp:Transcript_75554/g.151866  ORF Transcript_75554/g.151866 Transcript_75554/m.151866 type:complete len:213 (+) Transcript_75554:58-696(+)|eukprot:CAMPEP_0171634808 /NCGR_PEP_ID=MMETSP0990-20121206/26190_1 /TAXON_ID=483369 /ORGANISM="non described non described, Strain CCMP2098" /LENGTH=212 /DNA_ID=CAMNT_0012206129 /DNA_START=51 /DNA_END=689 /DNA_ORIENTATION=-